MHLVDAACTSCQAAIRWGPGASRECEACQKQDKCACGVWKVKHFQQCGACHTNAKMRQRYQ